MVRQKRHVGVLLMRLHGDDDRPPGADDAVQVKLMQPPLLLALIEPYANP